MNRLLACLLLYLPIAAAACERVNDWPASPTTIADTAPPQTPPDAIEVGLHARVDTTDPEVKAIAELWTRYLCHSPDSIYDNPCWNTVEKRQFKDCDLSRRFMYQMPAQALLTTFKPTILSIEREGERYAIRTLFAATGLAGESANANPWCITRLYATREPQGWRLMNALPVITEHWSRQSVGNITFVYPPTHRFDAAKAGQGLRFCEGIVSKFGFEPFAPFTYYITDSPDEMGRLLNFDFYFAGYTSGVGLREERLLLTGTGSEFYPHEFVHLVVPRGERHDMVEEGFATWLGGTAGREFEENAANLAAYVVAHDTLTFEAVLQSRAGWQAHAFYTTGALLCQAAFAKGGLAAIQALLATPRDDDSLIATLCAQLGLKPNAIDAFWKAELARYRRN